MLVVFLGSCFTTDTDGLALMFSTFRFVTDTIWYPEIAQALSPRVSVDRLSSDFLGGG